MNDATHAIKMIFQDALHSVQHDVVQARDLFEYTDINKNTDFEKEYHLINGAEALARYPGPFGTNIPGRRTNEFSWYIFPFKNGSSAFYTTNQ
jgi:hypothetical protein